MENEKIAIIIVNWNGKNDTISCLNSLKHLTYPFYEIILVDNGSTDDSVEIIKKKFPNITILETHKNLGFAGGNNYGIKYALNKQCFKYFFLLNNDTIVDKDILSAFIQASKKNEKAGIFGGKILRYSDRETIDHFGGYWDNSIAEFTALARGEKANTYLDYKKVDYVCGCCFFIKKEVIEKIGLLEEKFFLIWEEADFCFRAKRNGFEIISVPFAILWHKVSASFNGKKPHMHYYWWRNRLLWIERNCKKEEMQKIYKNLILREIKHIFKLRYLKSPLLIFSFFSPSYKKRKEKLLCYKAGVRGIRDYFLKRFGKGPNWISK